MHFCPICQTEIRETAVYCHYCGNRLPRILPINRQDVPGFYTTQDRTRICNTCGHVNLLGETFCNQCGVQLPPVVSQPPPPPSKTHR